MKPRIWIYPPKETFVTYLIVLLLVVWTPVPSDSGALLGIFRIEGTLERFINLFLLAPTPILLVKILNKIPLFLLLIIGPLVSGTIEVVQRLIPGRVSDPIDIALNSLGYIFFAILLLRNRSIRSTYKPNV